MHRYLDGYLRQAALAVAVAAGVGTAAAQPAPSLGLDRQEGVRPGAQLSLTPTQKTAIFEAVKQSEVKPTAPPRMAPTAVAVGAQLPPSIELHVLPDAALAQAPETKLLQYTVVDSQVVLVDPTTMRVVDIIRQ
jgi:hypothetical protein